MAIDTTLTRIGLTFVNAVLHYMLYRFVVFFIITTKDGVIKFLKSIIENKSQKRSIGTSSIELITPNSQAI